MPGPEVSRDGDLHADIIAAMDIADRLATMPEPIDPYSYKCTMCGRDLKDPIVAGVRDLRSLVRRWQEMHAPDCLWRQARELQQEVSG